jgi:hypothetical protein
MHRDRPDVFISGSSARSRERSEPLGPPVTAAPPECPVLARFEELVEAVLSSPPPVVATADPDWRRLFRWCDTHRGLLAERASQRNKLTRPQRADVWLRELASPPKTGWDGVRHGALPFIRLVGMLPRSSGEPMFTGGQSTVSRHGYVFRSSRNH